MVGVSSNFAKASSDSLRTKMACRPKLPGSEGWSGRRDSNPRPRPWQGYSAGLGRAYPGLPVFTRGPIFLPFLVVSCVTVIDQDSPEWKDSASLVLPPFRAGCRGSSGGQRMPKITKRLVDAIRPIASREQFVWDEGDGALKGFGVRIKPSGVGAYILQYRNAEGRTRRLALGRVGVLTPEQARKLASEKLHDVAKGGDPSAARRAARNGMMVSELCDWYLADAASGKILGRKNRLIKSSTLAADLSRIERHVKPLIGKRAVAGLTLADIEKVQADIAAGKTAKKRPTTGRTGETTGGRGVAGRTVGMLGAILELARRHKVIEHNPARGVRRFADNKSERFLSIEEVTALGRAIREAEHDGKSRTGLAAIRALLLTGCRKNEILTLPREWFDRGARCIRFGDTKSGAQIRPLGAVAVEHLALQENEDGARWLFPAERGDGHFIGLARVLANLCARAELSDVSPHTLRHTFGSIAAELGFSEITIAGLLGHAARGVTQRYSHVPDSALLAAADRVSYRIAVALDGEAESKVVPLKARA